MRQALRRRGSAVEVRGCRPRKEGAGEGRKRDVRRNTERVYDNERSEFQEGFVLQKSTRVLMNERLWPTWLSGKTVDGGHSYGFLAGLLRIPRWPCQIQLQIPSLSTPGGALSTSS
ncbi:hypothetical protein E2C01_062838 [Portunus trituberculatus]|uniref:Uncharacterized protein n=1 Tax=Portunus trituberculatus TaxID=210409 RepID=A0A5B7HGJ5_PORTR|nr:hypothetical protein [Portunus trituberculatus]